MKAFGASDADMVEKNQTGGEKPVLLIGSPMCCIIMIKSQNVVERHARRPGGQGVIATTMRDANRVSEVKYTNFVEQCVRHPEEKEMCQVLGNAGRLFLHENLWDRWSRELSFVKQTARSDDVHKTKSELCRAQLTMWSPRRGSCFESKSVDRNTSHVFFLMHLAHVLTPRCGSRCLKCAVTPSACHP